MEIIKKIDMSKKDQKYEKEITRRSVRGVIKRDNKLLVLYLDNLGEYKLPGGGVEKGETLIDALKREVLEEVGREVKEVIKPLGKIIHKKEDKENENNLFTQISYYYLCEVKDKIHEIKPSLNELRYGIIPMWEDIDKIIETNKKNLGKMVGHFSVRELFTFDYIKKLIETMEI